MSKVSAVTANTVKAAIFSDFFTDFSRSPTSGMLNKKTNEDAVKQSIRNLLLTDKYERPYQPELGSNIQGMLFENWTPSMAEIMKNHIQNVFDNHEPRAELVNCVVHPTVDNASIVVKIYFRLINSENTVEFDVILKRVR
jgi:phage baseplate assembly protein W